MVQKKLTIILEKIREGYSLPVLSVVAMKLVQLASDDNCSAQDLADLIEKDPPLTVRLLKLANSAFFRSGQPITTIEQAIVKVGFHRLRIMALSLSLRDTFPMGKIGSFDYEKFWRASLYRALLARSLAQHLKNCNPEEAFVSGLILEIGLLIFFDILNKEKDENISIDPYVSEDILRWENKKFGVDHRQVGKAVLQYWKFPKHIIDCQGFYRDLEKINNVSPLATICELARRFSLILFKDSKNFESIFDTPWFDDNLTHDMINDILVNTFDQVEGIAENLRVELNSETDLLDILEKANSALTRINEKIETYNNSKMQSSGIDIQPPSFQNLNKEEEITSFTLQAVAHEIRNPLLAVGGFAKKLVSSLDPSEGGKYANVIVGEALRLEKALAKMTGSG